MQAEIEVIDQTEEIMEKQHQDIVTYHQMVSQICAELREGDIDCTIFKKGKKKYLYDVVSPKKGKDIAEIFPVFLTPDSLLEIIVVDIHNKDASASIIGTLDKYSDKYNHLKKITINPYF